MKIIYPVIAGLSAILLCGCTNLAKTIEEDEVPVDAVSKSYTRLFRGKILDRFQVIIGGYKYTDENDAQRYCAGTSFTNILGNKASSAYGLDYEYDTLLRLKNLHQLDKNDGISIITTLSVSLQDEIYSKINEKYNSKFCGSAVVMGLHGDILADVSYPSFVEDDFNNEPGRIAMSVKFKNQSLEPVPVHMRLLKNLPGMPEDPESCLETIHFNDPEFLDCDFAALENSLPEDEPGFMLVSPVYLASLVRSVIMPDGITPKPYILDIFTDPDDKSMILSDEEVISKLKNSQKTLDISQQDIDRWERILKQRSESKNAVPDTTTFREDVFDDSRGKFTASIPDKERFSFVGKIETERIDCFLCYGMLFDKEKPENSMVIVSANSAGPKDQEEMQAFFQSLINCILEKNPYSQQQYTAE